MALPRMTKKEGFTLHPFDAKHGVQTSGLIPGRYLKTGHTHDRHSTAYFGVAPSVFQALLQALAADETIRSNRAVYVHRCRRRHGTRYVARG